MDEVDGSAEGSRLPELGDGWPSPEEEELHAKRDELRRLHEQVVEREMKLAALQAQIEGFCHEELLRLGRLYARIDDLQEQIAEVLLGQEPENPALQRRVQEARANAQRSREAAADAEEIGPPQTAILTQKLKELYRDAALRLHPDLGRTPEERKLRHDFMVRLNAAYTACDIEGVQEVLAAWEAQAEPPEACDVAEALVRTIRAIHRLRRTLERLEGQISGLRARPEHKLMVRAHRAEAEGRDLWGETEERLQDRIDELEQRLLDLENGAGP